LGVDAKFGPFVRETHVDPFLAVREAPYALEAAVVLLLLFLFGLFQSYRVKRRRAERLRRLDAKGVAAPNVVRNDAVLGQKEE
jgi:hypothetical protein